MSNITLYNAEERLAALLNCEETVPDEMLAEFRAELTAAGEIALDKRDRCIQFIRHIEAQISFAKTEEARVAAWRKSLESGLERFESYVLGIVEAQEPPKKGPKKLVGRVGELRAASNPASVEIRDLEKVPYEFLTATVKLRGALVPYLQDLIKEATKEAEINEDAELFAALNAAKFEPVKSAIKKAIEANQEVPGADLKLGGFRLEIK